jgi:hypothetical protein
MRRFIRSLLLVLFKVIDQIVVKFAMNVID